MSFKHCTIAYDQCLSAIKLLTFRCLPYPPCAYSSEEEQTELEEECNTFTGYGTLSMEMEMLYPCISTGARLVFSRPHKGSRGRKSWPSASNPSEIQAFYDKQLSRSATPSSETRRSSRISRPVCPTPEPTTPITPSCPSLTTSPSSADSTFSILDTPRTGYNTPMCTVGTSPSRSRLPISTSNLAPGLQRSGSPTPRGNERNTPLLTATILTPMSCKKRNPKFDKSDPPVSIAVLDSDNYVGGARYGHVTELPEQHHTENLCPPFELKAPTSKWTGRIPRFVGTTAKRLRT